MLAAGLLLVNLKHMSLPTVCEEEKSESTTTPYLLSLGKHRIFIDVPTHATVYEARAIAASHASMYHQAFAEIPEWLYHVLSRHHHSHLFGKHTEWRYQRDPGGAIPKGFPK